MRFSDAFFWARLLFTLVLGDMGLPSSNESASEQQTVIERGWFE
jgi:hypothetical protein